MKFAIMGTGVMGCGWITQCALSGHDVHCYDSNTASVASVAAKVSMTGATPATPDRASWPNISSPPLKT
jgi:3-hydroxyacyl-CoA dehydrogenase